MTANMSVFGVRKDNYSASITWVLWFIICLIPFSLPGGYSANYLFIFTPLIYLLTGKKLRNPTKLLNIFFVVSIVIFVIATLYQVQFYDLFIRRLISFVLILSIYSFVVIEFSQKMINSFLLAVVAISVYFSLESIYNFITSGFLDPATLKGLIGTQRIGFMYIFSIWILWSIIKDNSLIFRNRLIAFFLFNIIIVGLMFTFSRSSYVAMLGGIIFSLFYFRFRFQMSWLKNLLFALFMIGAVLISVYNWFPQFFTFLEQRIIFITSLDLMYESFENTETSEGSRIETWRIIFSHVLNNPLTGSGYLGSWVLTDWTGSAHSEYFDRLLRFGFIGFTIYLLILYRIFKTLLRFYPYLNIGYVSVIVYGLFHETFSLSHGAVLFSFLLMLYSKHYRENNRKSVN